MPINAIKGNSINSKNIYRRTLFRGRGIITYTTRNGRTIRQFTSNTFMNMISNVNLRRYRQVRIPRNMKKMTRIFGAFFAVRCTYLSSTHPNSTYSATKEQRVVKRLRQYTFQPRINTNVIRPPIITKGITSPSIISTCNFGG